MSDKETVFLGIFCALTFPLLPACNSVSDPLTSSGTSQDTTAVDTADYATTTTQAESNNSATHETSDDYVVDTTSEVDITLAGTSITVNGTGASVAGTNVTITSAGTYRITGTLTDGRVIVNTKDDATVKLILNGVDLRCSTSAPIQVSKAAKVVIVLADNTTNHVADGSSYVLEDPTSDEPNAAIFSSSDLTIYGNGTLNVEGNYNDGIASKDGLIIESGTITVNSADDGIRGKDYLVLENGTVTVNARGDGLKSDNDQDTTKGYIAIQGGTVKVTAGGDAITAQTDAMVTAGNISLSAGGGSGATIDSTASAKGIKGSVNVIIDGGTIAIDSADDAIHSNGQVTINAGSFTIATGDDGMHADATLAINGGDIRITKSYEGIESRSVISITAGQIHVVSSDDGLNIANGLDNSGMGPGFWQQPTDSSGDGHLYISGGYLVVDAGGDGLDIGGAVEMTGGTVIVNGPTANDNGALDHTSFKITGGFLLAVGSSGMAQAPGTTSTQYSMMVNLRTSQRAGTLVHIQSPQGADTLTFSPAKAYQSIVFSAPQLVGGATYGVYLGGSSTGTATDGLYQGGTYTPGSQYASVTLSSIVTNVR